MSALHIHKDKHAARFVNESAFRLWTEQANTPPLGRATTFELMLSVARRSEFREGWNSIRRGLPLSDRYRRRYPQQLYENGRFFAVWARREGFPLYVWRTREPPNGVRSVIAALHASGDLLMPDFGLAA